MIMLLDIAPGPRGIVGIVSAVAFFFILAAAAFIAFKLLKRSVKMALRVGIVAVILAVAVTGSVALWAFSSASSEKPRPARNR
jgi:hypothetical protein